MTAGPAPSWLWLCGVAYCKESLTDGFIPDEALQFLGVKKAKQLAHHLVLAKLWDHIEGGFRVHDYLKHNADAETIKAHNAKRGENGAKGGRKQPRSANLGRPESSRAESSQVDQKDEESVALPSSTTPAALTFPVVGRGPSSWALSDGQIAEWATAFPGISVLGECRKALAWVQARPQRRKTARGMSAFLVGWLNRATDSGRGPQPAADRAATQTLDWYGHFPHCRNEQECVKRFLKEGKP